LGAWKFSLFQDLSDDLYGFLEGLNFPRLDALFHFKIESDGDSADLLVAILRCRTQHLLTRCVLIKGENAPLDDSDINLVALERLLLVRDLVSQILELWISC